MIRKKENLVYIIPTYNEKENIYSMLSVVIKILRGLNKYNSKLLIVDDNSPDGTGEAIKKFQKQNSSVILLSGKKNGLGSAIIRGYKFAINKLKADIIITNEADFSYPPANISTIIQKLEDGFDVVNVKRKTNKNWSIGRRIIHFVANTIFGSWIAKINEISDHDSAFKGVKVKGLLNKINFAKFPKGFAFFIYLNFQILKLKPKLYELSVTYQPRTKGQSKVSLNPKYFRYFVKDSLEYMKVCFRIRKEKIYDS